MHAPPHRGSGIRIAIGKKRVAALAGAALALLAGCSGAPSDNPAVPQPSASAPPGTLAAAGPAVSIIRVSGLPVPQLAGEPAVDATLRKDAATLAGTCTVVVERDDPRIASFLWTCSNGKKLAATFDLRAGRQVGLDQLFYGSYRAYLSSTAIAQMRADGLGSPSATDFSLWYLTPVALVVAFPDRTVSFPLDSLGSYIRPGGPLAG